MSSGWRRGKAMSILAQRDDSLEYKVDEEGWFEVKLSLTEGGMTSVKFVDYDDDHDEQWDAEKIRGFKPLHDHIRLVSEQLQDEECRKVIANQTVCALWNAENKVEGLKYQGWYDAFVTEVTPLKHDVQDENETCTCLFTVTWLDGPAKGKRGQNLTCGNICLLSTKDVETHPLISDILSQANRQGRGKVQEEIQGASLESRDDQRIRELGLSSSTSELITEYAWEHPEQAVDAGIQDDPLSSHSAEDNEPNDFSCTSTKREIQDASSEFRTAEAIRRMGLSSSTARLLTGEKVGENLSNPDPLEQSVQSTDAGIQDVQLSSHSAEENRPKDFSNCTSAEREIQDTSLEFCPAESIRRMGLSSATAWLLIGEKMGENLSNPDPLEQSVQARDAGIQDVQLSSQSAEDNRPNDFSTCTSTEREIQDTSLEFCPAESIRRMGLSSATARLLIGEKVGENLSNPDPLEQSVQVRDAEIQDVQLLSRSAEDNRPTKKMRGQVDDIDTSPEIIEARDRILGSKSSARVSERNVQQEETMSPNTNSSVSTNRVQQKTTSSAQPLPERRGKTKVQQETTTSAKPLPERRAKTRVVVDLTEDAACAVQPKKETVKAMVDSLEEHHLHSRPSAVQVKDENVEAKADSLQEHHLSSRPSEVQGKEENVKAETKADPLSKRHLSRAEVLPSTTEEMKTEAFCYSRRKKVLAVSSEAHRSKRLRITFDIDMEERPGSVDESFGGPKMDQFLHLSAEEEFKVGLRLLGTRLPRALSANEELVDSNSLTRLGSTPKSAICLSDEDE